MNDEISIAPPPFNAIIPFINSSIHNIVEFCRDWDIIHVIFSISSKCNINTLFKSIEIITKKQNIPIMMGYNNDIHIHNKIFIYCECGKLHIECSHLYYDLYSIFLLLETIDSQLVSNICETSQYKSEELLCPAFDYRRLCKKENFYRSYSINIHSSIQFIHLLQKYVNIVVIVDSRKQDKCINQYGNHARKFFIKKNDNFIELLKASKTIADFQVQNYFLNEPFVLFNSILKLKLPSFIDELITVNVNNIYPVIFITPISNVSGESNVLCNPKGFEFLSSVLQL